MATITHYLKKRKSKDLHPLYLRITHNRKSRMLHTDIELKEADWNEEKKKVRKSHTRYKKMNNYLMRNELKAKGVLLDLTVSNDGFSIDDIVEAIENNGVEKEEPEASESSVPDFFEYAEEIIRDYKPRISHQRWKGYKTVLNKLRECWKKNKLSFAELDVKFLRKYEAHCYEERGNKPNTVQSNLKKVRTIFNDAIKEGVIPGDLYPFRYYNMPSNKVFKTKLSEAEISKIESIKIEKGKRLFDTQKIFLFSYYCWGMRVRDTLELRWKNIRGDRLNYIMSKTDTPMSIKIPPQAMNILEKFKSCGKAQKKKYIFPFLDHRKDYSNKKFYQNQLSSKNSLINKYLKKLQKIAEIDKNISFHVARHSFAQRCLENGYRVIEIRDLLGHENITTTMTYLKTLGQKHLDSKVEGLFN